MLTPFALYPSAHNALPPDNPFSLRSFFIAPLEESVKAALKLSIQNIKIMASSPIASWQIDAKKVETVADLIFLGSKITADSDCSLLLGRKAMTNLESILKSRDIILHIVKGMFFPVVMYGCKRWTIKKAECQRIDAFKLWCSRKLLRIP